MKIIFVVLFALLILAAAGLVVWYLLLKLTGSERIILTAVAAVGVVLLETLLILAACIPSKADKLITSGIVSMENGINSISPDYVNQPLETEQLKSVLTDYNNLETTLKSNAEASLVIKAVGVGAYMGYLSSFVNSIDANIRDMEAEGTDITIHNVLLRLQDKSHEPIRKTTKVLEVLVIVISFIFVLALIVAWAIIRSEKHSSPKVTVVNQEKENELTN